MHFGSQKQKPEVNCVLFHGCGEDNHVMEVAADEVKFT